MDREGKDYDDATLALFNRLISEHNVTSWDGMIFAARTGIVENWEALAKFADRSREVPYDADADLGAKAMVQFRSLVTIGNDLRDIEHGALFFRYLIGDNAAPFDEGVDPSHEMTIALEIGARLVDLIAGVREALKPGQTKPGQKKNLGRFFRAGFEDVQGIRDTVAEEYTKKGYGHLLGEILKKIPSAIDAVMYVKFEERYKGDARKLVHECLKDPFKQQASEWMAAKDETSRGGKNGGGHDTKDEKKDPPTRKYRPALYAKARGLGFV